MTRSIERLDRTVTVLQTVPPSEEMTLKVQLMLDPEQVDVLRELLDSTIRDLNYEISNTDNSVFKHGLHERRTTVRALLDALVDERQDGSRPGTTAP